MTLNRLDELYSKYGYELRKNETSYRVYVLPQGVYHGADIVVLKEDFDVSGVRNDYSSMGYATVVRGLDQIEKIEDQLFSGFFKTDYSLERNRKRYKDFCGKRANTIRAERFSYEYIDVPYQSNFESGKPLSLIQNVENLITSDGAKLIIIEAAAGFGKTCTSYEILNAISENKQDLRPLFTELSRNRGATRFKYVLWSEIDHEYNAVINSDLVIHNIQNGKIPLIIDGFDELLTKKQDRGKEIDFNEDFEEVESMLSTIGELLEGNAKVVLTSRKTAIFSGDAFSNWVDEYNDAFEVVRFQIEKPKISNWLSQSKLKMIQEFNIPINHISNPVLLTYLKFVNEDTFKKLLENPGDIVERYFKSLLEREKERQDINIPYLEQLSIFIGLAVNFTEFNIKSEQRNFVKELITEYNRKTLNKYRAISPNTPSLEAFADTLTNHALLDRKGNREDNIGFINEFIFGTLLGKGIVQNRITVENLGSMSEETTNVCFEAFYFESESNRRLLWNKFQKVNLNDKAKLLSGVLLRREIFGEYKDATFDNIDVQGISFLGTEIFSQSIFTDCTFEDCYFEVGAFAEVSFVGCKFVNCNYNIDHNQEKECIFFFGCEDYDNGFIAGIADSFENTSCAPKTKKDKIFYEKEILQKYFRVDGKKPRMKTISSLRLEFSGDDQNEVFKQFDNLKRQGYILVNGNNSHLSSDGINFFNEYYRA